PPRFFANVKFHRHTDRTIGWLELFYDLVYVATLIQIGNFLSDNDTPLGFAQFLVLMAVVWWAWTGETFYQNRYVVDDLLHRVLVFAQMFAIASVGLSVSAAFGDLYIQFTLAYVITRLMLVLMYARTYRAHPESGKFARGYIIGFMAGIVIWLGSLALPAGYHWVGWLVGIVVEFSVPQLPGIVEERRKWGVDVHHISERFGIFTIIVLGESFVKVLDDAQGATIGVPELAFSTFGLLVVYSLWWLYFEDTAGKEVQFAQNFRANCWVYGHLPLATALVAFGVAAKKVFGNVIDYPGEAVTSDYRLLYTVSIVLFLLALALIDYGLEDDSTTRDQQTKIIVHLVCAAIVAFIGLVFTGVTPVQFVIMISLVMVGQVIFSIYQTRQITNEEKLAHPEEPAAAD
ncbi:MAG: low temperature requirement protein A, partial [Chloroflexota bacterium]